MAAVQPGVDTAGARAAAIKLLEPDFHGLLQVKGVSELLQAKLAIAEVRSVSRINAVADDRATVRQFCERSLQLRQQDNMVAVATIVDVWEAAQVRMSVRHKAEAEANIADLPRSVNKVEVQDLIVRYESIHGYKLEDKVTPATTTLEVVFDQLEQGEMKNMSLVQFVSREDSESEIFGVNVEKGTGTLRLRKGYGECQKPRTLEELRQRMQVVAHTYLLAQLKYPQREQLKELQPQHFLKYLDMLLGEHVLGLKAKNKDGEVVATPDFGLVLAYEYQIRRNVTKQMNEGTSMVAALKAAMNDTVIKERYFITPNVYNCTTSWRPVRSAGDPARHRGRTGGEGGKEAAKATASRARRVARLAKVAKARRARRCMIRQQMAGRYAGNGTASMNGAGTNAVGCMSVWPAWAITLCMPAATKAAGAGKGDDGK